MCSFAEFTGDIVKGEDDPEQRAIFKDVKFTRGASLYKTKFATHLELEFQDCNFGGNTIGFKTINLEKARDLETTEGLVDPEDLKDLIWTHEKDMLLAVNLWATFMECHEFVILHNHGTEGSIP